VHPDEATGKDRDGSYDNSAGAGGAVDEVWDDFQNSIFSQDAPIVESQRPELLPLYLQAELHLRSDRLAIAYRRWLKEMTVRFYDR
jgi:phenylpropionate dioxygenase-like ring-hydroxylating dioxygenase large terminal subunit